MQPRSLSIAAVAAKYKSTPSSSWCARAASASSVRTFSSSRSPLCFLPNLGFAQASFVPSPASISEFLLQKRRTMATQSAAGETATGSEVKLESALPPLSDHEFKAYNRLADKMDIFHDHFRNMWKTLHDACKANKRPEGLSIRAFIDEGLMLIQYLTAHHSIEESYFFPVLARKMPEFRKPSAGPPPPGQDDDEAAAARSAHLTKQHEQIHKGMDGFEDYLRKCRSGETELDLRALKEQMDSWGDVLWQHLEDEVKCLGAENMRRYWSLAEIRSIPI